MKIGFGKKKQIKTDLGEYVITSRGVDEKSRW